MANDKLVDSKLADDVEIEIEMTVIEFHKMVGQTLTNREFIWEKEGCKITIKLV